MTRDEATQVAKDIFVNGSDLCQVRLVDMFVGLGMLKLDEPDDEKITQRLLDACRGVPYLATTISETLAKAGLKIVSA